MGPDAFSDRKQVENWNKFYAFMICPFGRSKTQALAIYIAIYIESLTRAKMSMLALCGPPTHPQVEN